MSLVSKMGAFVFRETQKLRTLTSWLASLAAYVEGEKQKKDRG